MIGFEQLQADLAAVEQVLITGLKSRAKTRAQEAFQRVQAFVATLENLDLHLAPERPKGVPCTRCSGTGRMTSEVSPTGEAACGKCGGSGKLPLEQGDEPQPLTAEEVAEWLKYAAPISNWYGVVAAKASELIAAARAEGKAEGKAEASSYEPHPDQVADRGAEHYGVHEWDNKEPEAESTRVRCSFCGNEWPVESKPAPEAIVTGIGDAAICWNCALGAVTLIGKHYRTILKLEKKDEG